jgi:HPt (histidine-containing phosphotransfer) domain-containing protein
MPEINSPREAPKALRLVSSRETSAEATEEATSDEASFGPVIDGRALDNIRALQRPGLPDLLQKIVTLYLEDSPRLAQCMRNAITAGDSSALQRAAHTLKSSSANLGALTLARMCNEMEVQARAEHLVDAEQRINLIEREYARVRVALPNQGARA